jgi:hypothetical protein
MKTYKSLFLAIFWASIISCNSSNKNVVGCAIFLNPSQAFYSKEVHFKAKLDEKLILDTIVRNKRVDESQLLRCLFFDKSEVQALSIDINGKKKSFNLSPRDAKCVNVFIRIDDHYLLDRKAATIEETIRNSDSEVHYQNLIDSLRKNSKNNQFDSISVNIKTDTCLCKD